MSTKPKIVQCFSGGLDSTVLLYHLRKEGYEVHCLSVDYGQKHERELLMAGRITAGVWGLEHVTVSLSPSILPLLKGSSQTDSSVPVPEGHYAEESMKATVVPNRNMILLSLATAWAVSIKAREVAYAAHAGDHAIYPDCRPIFANRMADVMYVCDYEPIQLRRPFIGFAKADIVKFGAGLNVPFHLTYSCYKGGEVHCGKCGTCVERKEAFQLAGVTDPTHYEGDV